MRRNGFDVGRNPIPKPLDLIECRDAVVNPDGSEAQEPWILDRAPVRVSLVCCGKRTPLDVAHRNGIAVQRINADHYAAAGFTNICQFSKNCGRAVVKEQLIRYRPGRDLKPESRTDWNRLKGTSDEEVERAARDDPDAQPLSDEKLARGFRPKVLTALRKRPGLSQAEFARQFMLNLRTLQDWEQGGVSPKMLPEPICG